MHSISKIYNNYLLLFFLLALGPIGSIQAQQLHYKVYSLEQGMPQSEVWLSSFVKDNEGHLWVGTNGGGIVKLSGDQLQYFTIKDGLISNQIRSLGVGATGSIWVVTPIGVSKLDGVSIQSYLDEGKLLQNLNNLGGLPQITEGLDGKTWLKTNRNLFLLDKGDSVFRDYAKIQTEFSKAGTRFLSLTKDAEHNIFLTTNTSNSVWRFNGKRFERERWVESEISKGKIPTIIDRTDDGAFWSILTEPNTGSIELAFYKEESWSSVSLPTDFPLNGITDLMRDKEGNIWVASGNSGILKLKPNGETSRFNTSNGFPVNNTSTVLEDMEGNVWAGTFGSGIVGIPNDGFVNFSTKDGLSGNLVFGIYEDSKGNIWFGTNGEGFNKWDGEQLITPPNQPKKAIGRVDSFLERADGSMYICGRVGGLFHYDGKNIKNVNAYFGLPAGIGVTYIHEETDKFIIGAFGLGVVIWDKATKQITNTFNNTNGLDGNLPNGYLKDIKGDFWFANIGGVSKYDGNTCKSYKHNGKAVGVALQMTNGKNESVWGVEFNKGLFTVKDEKIVFLKLPNQDGNLYYSITVDEDGNLWLGTQKGVLKVVLDNENQISNTISFGFSDGLSGIEMNGKGAFTDSKGNIWFGHLNGVSKYTITKKKKNDTPPKTVFSGLELFFKSVDWGAEAYREYHKGLAPWTGLPLVLELPSDQNHLTFQFATLSYTLPEKTKRQWMLEGADKDWLPPTSKQEATYSNIQPGTYTFMVKSMNNDGIWGEPNTFTFTITPPFWASPWFVTLVILLVGGAIFGSVRWRINALKAKKEELERLVAERTSELLETNKQVTLKNTELEQQQEEILAQAEEIEVQNKSLATANEEVSEQNRNITSSITYARRIQDAMLPSHKAIKEALPDSFILYKPRDIVSGDFYWFEQQVSESGAPQTMIAVADCTGHGVPGAFMSMAGDAYLNLAVRNKKMLSPSQVLQELDRNIADGLKQGTSESRDGMDISLCRIDHERKIVEFAGAKSPLVYIQDGKLTQIKGSKSAIGGHRKNYLKQFEQHTIQIDKPTSFYLFSDGYADQFGGEENKKFMIRNLRELITQINHLPMSEQKNILENTLQSWMEGYKQIDDILVIGFRLEP